MKDAIELLEAQEPPTVREYKDLEVLRGIKSGKVLKSGCKEYVIFNGDWYRSHRYEWPMEPRVMTLEEALGAEECWLERKDGCVTVASIALNGQDSGGYDVDSNELNTMRSYIFHSGYYGKYWRCWNIRPTDAQREATAWEK